MAVFLKLFISIICCAISAGMLDRLLKLNDRKIYQNTSIYAVYFNWVVIVFRVLAGNGNDYLSFSFWDKNLRSYLKLLLLILVAYLFVVVLNKLTKRFFDSVLVTFALYYVLFFGAYNIVVTLPVMKISLLLGVLSWVLSIATVAIFKYHYSICDIEKKHRYRVLISVFALYACIFYIVGPTELFAYNSGDFVYSYSDFILLLLAGTTVLIALANIIIVEFSSDLIFIISVLVLFTYTISSYVQMMFLNGRLQSIDGSIQEWSIGTKLINICIHILIVAVLLLLFKKIDIKKYLYYISNIAIGLILVQLVALISIYISTDVIGYKSRQLIEDNILELSDEGNVVIFILDAYDTQMIDKVLAKNPDYLSPLHDFTYFNNMTSEYGATDGSLPYLLTGVDINEVDANGQKLDFYDDTHFLKDIISRGYGIKILTELKYVEEFDDGLIDNFVTTGFCKLDMDKTLSAFDICMKYKCAPYLFKDFFRYASYDLTNIIAQSNIYIMGTDDKFDDMIMNQGIISGAGNKAFRLYHLYGAHAPYYLDENADIDYNNNNPIAQWKGSLKIVYDYIDQLKNEGLYDDTTLIVMADHGLNNSQRNALDRAGMEYNANRSNPIFFIKRVDERHDELQINSKATSHRQFFDTVMKCIDENWDDQYSGEIWN